MSIVLQPIAVGDRPVTWAQAKAHLRLDTDADQTYVETLIDAATDHAQDALGMSLMSQSLTAVFLAGQANPFRLPMGPVIAVTGVTNGAGNAVTQYVIERVGTAEQLRVNAGLSYPLTVAYTAGHASAAAIPAAIRQAILMHVATLYKARESLSDKAQAPVPHSLDAFYRLKSRNVGVG